MSKETKFLKRAWSRASGMITGIIFTFLAVLLSVQPDVRASEAKNELLLTIFLRHDQSKRLDEIRDHLKKTGFDRNFPPEGFEIVSW